MGKGLLDALRRLSLAHLIPSCILVVVLFLAVFADFIVPHSPYEMSLPNKLLPPFWQEGGKLGYLLGTDVLGRDILSRTIMGIRVSLFVAFLCILAGGVIGVIVGMVSAYYGGKVDAVLARIAVVAIAFPSILMAMYLVVILGPSIGILIIVLGITLWARIAFVIRGEAKSLMERPFIAQARIIGCSSSRIMITHLFPNLLNTLIVLLTLNVGWVIIVESSLSFLGAGIPPPIPSLGGMVTEGREFISKAWWISVFPGSVIGIIVICFNMLGDWLRDTLDPHLRQI
jgi:peptide/nickel transport system permease protein